MRSSCPTLGTTLLASIIVLGVLEPAFAQPKADAGVANKWRRVKVGNAPDTAAFCGCRAGRGNHIFSRGDHDAAVLRCDNPWTALANPVASWS
jgi:hypothetical protein